MNNQEIENIIMDRMDKHLKIELERKVTQAIIKDEKAKSAYDKETVGNNVADMSEIELVRAYIKHLPKQALSETT